MKLTLWTCCLLILCHHLFGQDRNRIESTVQVLDIASGSIATLYKGSRHMEAPNWAPSGVCLVVNSNGKLYTLRWPEGQKMTLKNVVLCELSTGKARALNNDHGFSPDGDWLAISHHGTVGDTGFFASQISIIPSCGGASRQVTTGSPSYWHGWSPDGKTLAYCAARNGNFDVYTIPVTGGSETRLTTNPGLDDGPEYSPDGQYIYYNAYRDSTMEIWRIHPDGSGQEPVLQDQYDNWFAHLSPDGTQFVTITYLERQHGDHPFGKQVKLRLYNLQDHSIRDLTDVFLGGQGTINVPSWSPDGKRIAFVQYRVLE
ncbi:WD40-like Beta Propeller Repeat [Chitinophaga costaii]|uniref:WD40-like Beta Propeller Repeat n=1 Tax=Chitinophaga costaii TaxID=1335309 RepID=A0A1C4CPV1_9BACT|nr:TolB family protein [Chitinophaga costaii]PUZ27006.1 transporter [Chitinophaga costaii]SCC21059.1 WD40-like Beta Propeller Repeat [Chitinophaga costaii]